MITDMEVVPVNERAIWVDARFIPESPQNDAVDGWVAEVEREGRLEPVRADVLVRVRQTELGDPQRQSRRSQLVQTSLVRKRIDTM